MNTQTVPTESREPQPARSWPFRVPAKYQVMRVLGSGGMGTVLLARDRHLGRLVALKSLRESCSTFLARFRREARMMARLVHPAIVKIHELEVFEDRTYLAMEYVDGGSLELAQLAPNELARTLLPVVDALGFAHAAGIVHRDVKPQNVLLDRRGRAFLTDFGIAYDRDEGMAREHARPLVGTPLTMSPEQTRGESGTPMSDQFSLGATLYRGLTGEWPFRGRTVVDVFESIRNSEPRAPRACNADVSRALDAVVLQCLAKEPEQRFESMHALGSALDRATRRGLWARAGALFSRPSPEAVSIHPAEPS
ncbi:MAG: serine/threonine protein kinase [bacterium]|nr:serine/threonine protein kinase [bacterium]